jgi:hypothetical protein
VPLVGKSGGRFELAILGYQFPAIVDDEWDSNWRAHERYDQNRSAAISESSPHRFRVHAGRNQQAGEGVTTLVQADRFEISSTPCS